MLCGGGRSVNKLCMRYLPRGMEMYMGCGAVAMRACMRRVHERAAAAANKCIMNEEDLPVHIVQTSAPCLV